MSKPIVHARSSVNKWRGEIEDYLSIHDFMDSSKSAYAAVTHRCVLHSAFGIYLVEKVFGHTITNSDDRVVSVRAIAERHVIEDLGWIPSLSHWLDQMTPQPWMAGRGPKPNAENRRDQRSEVVSKE